MVNDIHGGICGVHYTTKVKNHKILRAGYWCPSLFRNFDQVVRRCEGFQWFSGRFKYSESLSL